MFATIGHTFGLMKMSWRVLMKDRELIVFPLLSGLVLLFVIAGFGGVALSTGTLDRLEAQQDGTGQLTVLDIALGVVLYGSTSFVVIFFNAALVAAAMERLRGGDPNVRSGLRAAYSRVHTILGWALIAATIGLVLQLLRGRTDNFIGRLVIDLIGGVWTYVTFFVVPVLVAEGIGPIDAIKRSGGLFRETWGRQVTSSFGFALVYIAGVVLALIPAALLFSISPLLGFPVGALLLAAVIGTVQALEGIFKAALYEYANGETPTGFDRGTLAGAYRAL